MRRIGRDDVVLVIAAQRVITAILDADAEARIMQDATILDLV